MIRHLLAVAFVATLASGCAARGAETSLAGYNDIRSAIDRGAWVDLAAYTLVPQSDIVRALAAKARSHHPVQVLLTGQGFDYAIEQNQQVATILRAAGAKVLLSDYPLHMKLLVTPAVAMVSDTNFTRRGLYLILPAYARATAIAALSGQTGYAGSFTTSKGLSLRVEAALLSSTHGSISLQSESFGDGNPVYDALVNALARHRSVVVTVNKRDLSESPTEYAALDVLRAKGARVLTSDRDDKFATVDGSCWWGSSNSSPGLQEQVDWGIRFDDSTLCRAIQARL
jgi:hypothetical protein